MRGFLQAACLVAMTAVASPALAGFTASTGADVGVYSDLGTSGTSVGDTFTMFGGTFVAYVSDTALDPQISAGDLSEYGYIFEVTVATISGNTATYNGTYEIFFNLDANNTRDPSDVSVSLGTLTATAVFTDPNNSDFNASLTQTAGPADAAYADLSYGGNPLTVTGLYQNFSTPGTASQSATFEGQIIQTADALDPRDPGTPNVTPVPEPATLGLLIMGLPLVLRRRRRTV